MDNVYLKINSTHASRCGTAESIHESAKDILRSQCHTTGEVLHNKERHEKAIKSKLDKKHNELTDIVYKLGNENLRATNDKGAEMEVATERTSATLNVAVERNGKMDRDLVRDQASENNDLLYTHDNMAMDGHKNTQLDICELENDVSLGAVENKGDLQLDIAHSEADVTLKAAENATQLSLEESQYKQRVELDAYKNKMAFAAEAEDCCCEIKERTTEKERETQLLAKEVDTRRMRDELALANTENLLLRFM